MEAQEKQIDLSYIKGNEQQQYSYKIKPYLLANFLGVEVAVLQEYIVTNKLGDQYKLYKTEDGNWYDVSEEMSTKKNYILRTLKSAIEKIEESKD